MKVSIIIPARMAATRFPGKPLVKIKDKPMIQWVYEGCQKSNAQQVIVATDSNEIMEAVAAFGGEARMTSPDHQNGTQRIAEVANSLDSEVIVNVQGDEPAIHPDDINAVIEPLQSDPNLEMTTIARRITRHEDMFNPNIVKVVCDKQGNALYFSRAPVPFVKHVGMASPTWPDQPRIHARQHYGIYGFRRTFLIEYVNEPVSELENIEGLEQLRALYMGARIRVEEAVHPSIGVDTPEDVQKVERYLSEKGRT